VNVRATLDRILAIGAKEFVHIRRDPRMIIAILIIPLVQLLLFAYAISFDVRHIPTVVLDLDKTAESRAYLESYTNSGFFDVAGAVDSYAGVDVAFESNRARAAVIVASGFSRAQAQGREGAILVLLDGSEPTSAQLGQAYATALNAAVDQRAMITYAAENNLDLTRVGQLEPRVRTWYNPEASSTAYLVPGLLVVIVMIVTVQQTAVTLVRERDLGTMQQMEVSPLRRAELMVGKMLPWAVLGFVDTIAIALAAVFIFGVPLRGDLLLLAVSMMLFIICSLGIGLMISSRAPSAESANIVALLISFLPAFMLSGFAFPLNSIPRFLQLVSYLFPGRYMIAISRGVFLKDAGWAEMWPQVVALAIYAVVSVAVSSALFSRRST
jgi:ABC-2 type transport system permease protein